ncbi:unnamed protein product [Psylliodes chrysocephalus]|uniref:Uncharacterized protein n=1 Tax=Psylliodes chrysocephalus TaxID=3402493 RepID=A0A9P0GDJ2_9CUCU|nr:unnamed protein product [Psylliodes chrysocephala]
MPNVLCCACKTKLYRNFAAGNVARNFNLPDYSLFRNGINTKSKSVKNKCLCYMCELVRKRCLKYVDKSETARNAPQETGKKKTSSEKRCVKCLTLIGRASSYPCTWCYAQKDHLDKPGLDRTIGNSLQHYQEWFEAGTVRKDAKKFKSCIYPPIFHGSKDSKILYLVPPPELHLLLGGVNTIVNHMFGDFEKDAANWIKKCNVQREVRQGGAAFTGNSCKILLSKVDLLRANCELGCLSLDCLGRVVHECFGMILRPNYKSAIADFRRSYLALLKSVTPKIQAIFFHVEEFCDSTGKALGFYSEQAIESVHHDFNET